MRFLSRIQIGRHYPVDSPVHNLDAAAKIACAILLIVAVFLADSPYTVLGFTLLIFGIIYLSGLPSLQILRGLRAVLVILIITSITQLLFSPGKVLVSIGPIDITNTGITNGILYSLRIVLLTLLISLLTLTTAPTELVRGFERLFKPLAWLRIPVHRLAMVLMLAFRFLPVLLTRADDIVTARDLARRGLRVEEPAAPHHRPLPPAPAPLRGLLPRRRGAVPGHGLPRLAGGREPQQLPRVPSAWARPRRPAAVTGRPRPRLPLLATYTDALTLSTYYHG
jgi:energy-coupling factor transporter transmembrane protein EcfT